MNHTPTPWTAYNAVKGRTLKNWHIKGNGPDIAKIANTIPGDEGVANAAHIVRCVNSHEAMLDALKQVEGAWRHFRGSDLAKELPGLHETINQAIAQAEA